MFTQTPYPFDIDRFLERGNFPESFLAETPLDARRWRQQYVDSLISGDVLDFEEISNICAMRLVFELLKQRVGSIISIYKYNISKA